MLYVQAQSPFNQGMSNTGNKNTAGRIEAAVRAFTLTLAELGGITPLQAQKSL